MSGTCKDCKHWSSPPEDCPEGDCKFLDGEGGAGTTSRAVAWDMYAGEPILIATGPDFGCVHHEQKQDT